MGAVTIQSDQWPVCFIKIDGEMTPADFEGYISAFNAFYRRDERFSIITWVKRFAPNTEITSRVGRWFKETEPLIRQHWVSNAMVSQSAGFRFLLSAVNLIKPLPTASKVCATHDEAIEFTRTMWTTPLPAIVWPF